MILIFLFCLLMLLNFTYRTSGKNLLSPSFSVCLSFSIAAIICISVHDIWNYEYSVYGILIMVSCLFVFILGQLTGQLICTEHNSTYRFIQCNQYSNDMRYIGISRFFLTFTFICYCLFFACYVSFLFRIAYNLGWDGNVFNIISFIRQASIRDVGAISMPIYIDLLRMFFKALCYYLIYIFLHNYILCGVKDKILITVLFALMYLNIQFLIGGRASLLQLSAFIYATTLLKVYQKKRPSDTITYKAIKYSLLAFVLFVLPMFFIIGLAKKDYIYGIYNEFAIYGGSPLLTFDMYINGDVISHPFFGQECLGSLYRLLNRFGGDWPEGVRFLEFRYWGDSMQFSSNIYTAFRRYIQDFGFYGALAVIFSIGMFASVFFERIRRHRSSMSLDVVFASFFYIWLEFVIDEMFLYHLLSAGNITFILFIYIIVAVHRWIRKINVLSIYLIPKKRPFG